MIESSSGCRIALLAGGYSGGEASVADEVIDRGFVGAWGGAERGVCGRAGAGDLGQARDEEPLAEPGEEKGVADPAGGDGVAGGARDALDEAVRAEAPQLVADLPAGHVGGAPAPPPRQLAPPGAGGGGVGAPPGRPGRG